MDPLKTDCRHFRPDRPCAPHKAHGVVCATCTEFYDPITTRVLIVKLAAVGDVLRTTCLLPGIRRRWSSAHITWVTSPAAAPLFTGNRLVDRVLTFSGAAPIELLTEQFDVIINPDAAADACALAHLAHGRERLGFNVDARGTPLPLSPAAERWLEMGVRDDKKKANRLTYQEHMAAIMGVEWRREPPMLELFEEDLATGRRLRARHAPAPGGAVVGLNTGAGGRWRFKRWTEAGYEQLVARLHAGRHRVFLLGGPEEVERNARLAAGSAGTAVDTGCDNSLRQFAGIVDQCDVVVTGDTLAMHIAIARGKRTVVLFGPTSLHEIEVFDRGERLAPDLDCLVCYKSDCDFVPNCMESLDVDTVHAAVGRQIEALRNGAPAGAARGGGRATGS
ncbi:MAG TPA: glycosyltransferase family 9 protein [Planctomycetota bacterium]|nr:glycosyltransferase family 9 protein [Planctomycetota bacterium]